MSFMALLCKPLLGSVLNHTDKPTVTTSVSCTRFIIWPEKRTKFLTCATVFLNSRFTSFNYHVSANNCRLL